MVTAKGQNDPLAPVPTVNFSSHFVRGPCIPVPCSSYAKYNTFIQFLRQLSVLTVYVTSYLTTQSFSQYCNLSTDHCTAGPPNRLPSLHTRFKVEHVVNVVPKFSMKILVVGDCELVQLTPPGFREGYCATRYVMRFSEWNLFDASYRFAAGTYEQKSHSPLCVQGSQLGQ